MRKTRLVILPTKCLHQMGFLLLFLSCPVIGDWGRIRPESENSHEAIRIDREGTCVLQRDPPGKLLNFLYENGSNQCRLREDFDSNEIVRKLAFREVWRDDKRRVDLQRKTQERNLRERREMNDERRGVRSAMQRVADERRSIRREPQRVIRKDVREMSQIRSRNSESRQETERVARRQIVSAQRISNNQINSRNERERLNQIRRMAERQNDRRMEQQRRSVREVKSERRENERAIRTEREMRGGQTERLVRSVKRERQDIRRDNNRSLRKRESDVRERQIRERNQERQNERLSLARREQNNGRRTENGRNAENSERRLSQIRKTRTLEINGRIIEQRQSKSSDNRLDTNRKKLSQLDVRQRRVAPLNDRLDRMMEIKSVRVTDMPMHLPDDISLQNKNSDEKFPEGITKWMDLKRYESLKVGDWTTNCFIGAVIYFFSARQIKAV